MVSIAWVFEYFPELNLCQARSIGEALVHQCVLAYLLSEHMVVSIQVYWAFALSSAIQYMERFYFWWVSVLDHGRTRLDSAECIANSRCTGSFCVACEPARLNATLLWSSRKFTRHSKEEWRLVSNIHFCCSVLRRSTHSESGRNWCENWLLCPQYQPYYAWLASYHLEARFGTSRHSLCERSSENCIAGHVIAKENPVSVNWIWSGASHVSHDIITFHAYSFSSQS